MTFKTVFELLITFFIDICRVFMCNFNIYCSSIPEMSKFVEEHGRLTDGVIDQILEAKGLDMEMFHMRSDYDVAIEEQALNRQRVLWLNNEGFLRDMKEKKERKEAEAAEAARAKEEARIQKETARKEKEAKRAAKAESAARKRLEREPKRQLKAKARQMEVGAPEERAAPVRKKQKVFKK